MTKPIGGARGRRHRLEPRRLEPRHLGLYLDHGSSGVIVAERIDGNAAGGRLVWFKGHTRPACGVRGFGRVYEPAQLVMLDARGYHQTTLLTGGRLTKDKLAAIADTIDDHLGPGTTRLLDPSKTLVVIVDGAPDMNGSSTNRCA